MVRKCLAVVALLAVATPVAAQDDVVWAPKRPDAQAPFGVMGGRTLEMGEFELTYRFSKLNAAGIWFDDGQLSEDFTAEFYDVVPLSLVNETHSVGIAFAASPEFTVMANVGYSLRSREQLTSDGQFYYVTEADNLGDLEIAGLYKVFDQGPYRAHIQIGASIPTGSVDAEAETPFSTPGEEFLPYDMRAGAGTFAALPGLTLLAQNETGTVGAQIKGAVYLGTNDRDFAPGNALELNTWASYRANRYFSFSARAAYRTWGAIDGADPALDPLRDPGNDSFGVGGSRLDIPVGVNLYMPEGTRFQGHRLSVEYIFPATHKYDGPQLGADWGIVAGWQVVF